MTNLKTIDLCELTDVVGGHRGAPLNIAGTIIKKTPGSEGAQLGKIGRHQTIKKSFFVEPSYGPDVLGGE